MSCLRGSARAFFLMLLLPAVAPASPVPGGVLDETGRTGYFSTGGGIDAVSLARGELLWSTREAHLPLLAAGDRLYALATNGNVLYVRGFDLMNGGRRVWQSATITLPRWVETREAHGHSFRCAWRREKTTLFLSWQARAWTEGGPAKQAAGEVRIDLESGAAAMGAIRPLPPPEARVVKQLEKLALRWQRSIGGQIHVLAEEDVPGADRERQKRLVLRTWNEKTGQEGKAHELIRGRRPVVLVGLDGIQLWLRDAAPCPDEHPEENRQPEYWAVYSVLDGRLVARVPFVAGVHEAALVGDRAYCLVSAPSRTVVEGVPTQRKYTLHVIDIESGKTLWSRPLASKALAP